MVLTRTNARCPKASTPCPLAMSTPASRSCDYIKATVGFEKLDEATGTQPKSLMRMFGPRGNPQARNLFGIISYLQKQAGVDPRQAETIKRRVGRRSRSHRFFDATESVIVSSNAGVPMTLALAILFGASTPFSKLLLSEVDPQTKR